MLHALHKSNEVISKEIELNTFLQSSFIHQKSGEINVQQIHLSDNIVYLFTKSLPTSTFKKLVYNIEMRQLEDIDMRGSMHMT